jgi:hypothetical protein
MENGPTLDQEQGMEDEMSVTTDEAMGGAEEATSISYLVDFLSFVYLREELKKLHQ